MATPAAAATEAAIYVDDRELVRRTGIARATWQMWRQDGEGPPHRKCGRRVLYRWSEVEAWIEAGKRGGAR